MKMKGQASIETLMMLAASIGILSLFLFQINAVEKVGENAITKKETKEAEQVINSLCKITAFSNSMQETEVYFLKNTSIKIKNKYCEEKEINFSKGKNKLIFYPGSQVKIALTSI